MNSRLLLGVVVVCTLLVLLLMYGAHSDKNQTKTAAPGTTDPNSESPDEQGESGSLIEPSQGK